MISVKLNVKDPTRTRGLRNRYLKETTRRFNQLKRAITETIETNDALRLEGRTNKPVNVFARLAAAVAFRFTRDDQAIDEFMTWIKEEEAQTTLEVFQRPDPVTRQFGEPWENTYIRSSYQKGLADANAKLIKVGAGAAAQTAQAAFHQPFHIDRVRLIYTRVFDELKGVNETMNAAIRRELTQGFIEGVGPSEMARRVNNRVDEIGLTRAKLIARTETTQTHNEANLGEYQRASVLLDEEILVEWVDADDGRVRSKHENRDSEVFTQAGYAQRIGEPNCRCGNIPYLVSIEGKPERVNAVA